MGGLAASVVLIGVLAGVRLISAQDRLVEPQSGSVFSPAHATFRDALAHFLGWRREPVQPIPFPHRTHFEEAFLECTYCHDGAARGPVARIPSVVVCMDCHFDVATDREPIQLLTSFYESGQEPPWERVYGWLPEAHVRFNHAPHVRREIECTVCHGDVTQMIVAEPAVDHTMSFCVGCHEQSQASIDCVTCHY